SLDARIDARETAEDDEPAGFRLTGEGTLNGYALSLSASGGPLIHVRRGEPYAFDAVLGGAATRITAQGAIARPFDLGRITADITARGQDLADGYYLTTVPFPNTPPYELSGRLERDGETWSLADFTGR